jgi:hypothetical protein
MMSRNNREYQICKDIALYLRLQYPKVLFHFDLAGLNLSRAQAGMMKAIQGGRGWPDLFIAHPSKGKYGLFIEIKAENTRLWKVRGDVVNDHIKEQMICLSFLGSLGFEADFGVGFDDCKKMIDNYLR